MAVDETDIDLMRPSAERHLRGGESVGRQAERVGEVVGRAERQHGERLAEREKLRKGARDGPVAAADDDAVGTWPMRGERAVELILRAGGDEGRGGAAGEPAGERGQGFRRPGRLWINHDEHAHLKDMASLKDRAGRAPDKTLVNARARKLN